MLALLILAQAVPVFSAGGHGHGAEAFEWGGIFASPESTYLWTAQKVKSGSTVKYADATMKMAVLPATAATEAALHALEGEGSHSLNMTCTDVPSGGIITPKEDACYRLVFKQDWWQSLYSIDATGHAALAFFCEHVPTEFENTAHYLKDDHGDDIEPVAELPEEKTPTLIAATATTEKDDPWGPAIGTSIIVNLVTLLGVVFMVPALAKAAKTYAAEFECLTSAFAAGAIGSCAFFLLLFEATHLIAEDHEEEVDQIWRWGTMILAGAVFPVCANSLVELLGSKASDGEKGEETALTANPGTRARLISGVLIGDFMHNLCDGFFIGAAFKGCGETFGWGVAGATIAHELPQELADYVVLTGKDCQLHPAVALGLNFLSGTSVLLGTVIVLSTEVSNGDIGLLLAFGGGTYLYIAFVECMPKLQDAKVSGLVRLVGVFMFILGAIAIGLVLLDHEHCVPPPPPGAAPVKKSGHHH